MLLCCSLAVYWVSTCSISVKVFDKSLFSIIWKLFAIVVCRCYPEIKDHFRSTSTKIGICSPLRALKLEIPYCLNNPLHTLHLSSSRVHVYYSSSSMTALRTWGMEIASRVLLHSLSCLGLVSGAAEEPVSGSHLTTLELWCSLSDLRLS